MFEFAWKHRRFGYTSLVRRPEFDIGIEFIRTVKNHILGGGTMVEGVAGGEQQAQQFPSLVSVSDFAQSFCLKPARETLQLRSHPTTRRTAEKKRLHTHSTSSHCSLLIDFSSRIWSRFVLFQRGQSINLYLMILLLYESMMYFGYCWNFSAALFF